MSIRVKPSALHSHRVTRQNKRVIFARPLLVAVLSLSGLIIGLTGDGTADWVAWTCLFTPIFIFAIAWRKRS